MFSEKIYIPITAEILTLPFRFMEEKNTPNERPPMLRFKHPIKYMFSLSSDNKIFLVDLKLILQKGCELGGYKGCVSIWIQ